MRRHIFSIFKILLATFLIALLILSKKLSVSNIIQGAFENPLFLFLGAFSVFLMVFLGVARWHYLLKTQMVNLPFSKTLELSLIGLFFSTVMPGAISGDVVKAYYIARWERDKKAAVILTIGIDRVLSLLALMPVAMIAIAFNWKKVSSVPELRYLAGFIFFSVLGFVLIIPVVLSGKVKNNHYVVRFLNRIPFSGVVNDLYDGLHQFKNQPRSAATALAISVAISITLGLAFYFFGLSLGETEVSLLDYYLAAPLIIISMTLPLAPAGIGVGQVAALSIMNWIIGKSSSFGADVVTLLQFFRILISMSGSLIYVRFKDKVDLSELKAYG